MSREEREALVHEIGQEVRRHQNAQDRFDEAAYAHLGLNRTDGRALDIVDQHGRITAGRLAEESGLSTGAITTVLDRLERAGYVRRIRDAADRRRVFVELTDDARRRAWEIWGPIAEQAEAGFARYTDAELRFILDFMRAGRQLLTEHRERVASLGAGDGGHGRPA
jgi:DNA-binding MarR family transcriptional regulator